jgi:microcystin-dependent protein
LFDAICPVFFGTTVLGNVTISGVSEDLTNLGLIGAKIEGSGIPSGATVAAITANTITLDAAHPANGAFTATSLRMFPHGNGNASTTFTLPNAKGRTMAFRDNMGGNPANQITVGGAGFDGTVLGASGGAQAVQLLQGHMASHQHSASTSVGLLSGSVGAEPQDHAHYFSDSAGTSGASPATHVHGALAPGTSFMQDVADGTGNITIGSGNRVKFIGTTGAGGAHSHTVSVAGYTQGRTATHTHALDGLTLSAGTTVNFNSPADQAHNNTQPSIIENVVIKT